MSRSFEALRRANPRAEAGFDEKVGDAVAAVRARIATAPELRRTRPRRRLLRASIGTAALAIAAGAAVFLTVGSPSGPAVNDAAAAMRKAARLSAASAEQSGTAVVRIAHDGELWAGSTLRWNGDDVAVLRDAPSRKGAELLVVDGTLYGPDPGTGGWLKLGDPANIDPDSGATPAEYLAALRQDVGGATLRRLTGGMTRLTTRRLDDGSTVYDGTVAAGLIARETGFKEGHAIRLLPFGYAAHDEAADPLSPLEATVTVGAEGVVRAITVSWGTWKYTVSYSGLGATAAPKAPAHAKSLRELRGLK